MIDLKQMNSQHRNHIFSHFIKTAVHCQHHPQQIANMIVTKEEVSPRGLICALCLPPPETKKDKEDLEPKSLKMVLLQIHQSCTTVSSSITTTAFVDHHISLIRTIAKNHFQEIQTNLQSAITVYFQKTKELLNGKFFFQFYNILQHLTSLKNTQGKIDGRQVNKYQLKMAAFIDAFEKMANQYEQYSTMPLQEKMVGSNLVKYIKLEVGTVYKDLKDKVQNLKKNWQEEEILEMFNPYQSSLKSFRYSHSLLNSSLKLVDPKKVTMPNLPDNEYTLVSLIEPCIGNKKRSIKLKMDGIKGWVSAGIAYKSLIQNMGYKFEQNNHGTVQMSYDGYSWGNDSSTNEVYTSWYYNQSDVLTITANPPTGQLVFQKNEDTNVYTLKFKKEKKLKIYFCVSLNYFGDEVSILD